MRLDPIMVLLLLIIALGAAYEIRAASDAFHWLLGP